MISFREALSVTFALAITVWFGVHLGHHFFGIAIKFWFGE